WEYKPPLTVSQEKNSLCREDKMTIQGEATQDRIQALLSLIQVDIDAARAYAHAIAAVAVPAIRERLGEFREDHERHIADLSAALRALGSEPPERRWDPTGQPVEGYTAVCSAMGTAGALRAMKSNEILTNKRYEAARSLSFPTEIDRLVKSIQDDER